jgi:signal recognition particle subunit SRP54
MRAVTGKPIKFAGVGEALDKLEAFHPERVAGRILGMGDVVSLVEKAAETIQMEEAEKLAAKMAKGKFDLDDLWAQLRQMQRMGGLGALAGMMPGMKGAMDQAQNSKALVHMEAMLSSMTRKERSKPEIINAKRKIRIAKGSGTTVQEINKLLKMHMEMANAMKRLKKMGGLGKLTAMFSKGGLEGALGGLAPPGALPPGSMPGLGGGGPALPGLGGSAPFNLPPGFDKFTKR